MIKQKCLIFISLFLFLNGCNNHNEEKATNDEGDIQMEEQINFDWDKTVAVIRKALGTSDEEDSKAEAMEVAYAFRQAGVRGATRAKWRNIPEFEEKVLEIKSEDKIIYHLTFTISLPSGLNIIDAIIDPETGLVIYEESHDPDLIGPEEGVVY